MSKPRKFLTESEILAEIDAVKARKIELSIKGDTTDDAIKEVLATWAAWTKKNKRPSEADTFDFKQLKKTLKRCRSGAANCDKKLQKLKEALAAMQTGVMAFSADDKSVMMQ